MAIDRISQVLLGTDETTGITITTGNQSDSAEKDVLGGDVAMGYAHVYLKFTSTVTVGSVDVFIFGARVTGQTYSDLAIFSKSVTPINGTKKVLLGTFPLSRFVIGRVKNNATGANITNVLLALEAFKIS